MFILMWIYVDRSAAKSHIRGTLLVQVEYKSVPRVHQKCTTQVECRCECSIGLGGVHKNVNDIWYTFGALSAKTVRKVYQKCTTQV